MNNRNKETFEAHQKRNKMNQSQFGDIIQKEVTLSDKTKIPMKNIIRYLIIALPFLTILLGCKKDPSTVSVTGISLSQPSAELLVGETISLKATVSPSNASFGEITWATSKPSVATVSSTGTVKAVSEGSATITASTEGKTASCSITVISDSDTPEVPPVTPEESKSKTGEASSVTEDSAILAGYADLSGGMASASYGIEYTPSDFSTEAYSAIGSSISSSGNYSVKVTGLSSNTTYYYRSYILYNGVRTYGEAKSFKTPDFSGTVSITGTDDITFKSVTIKGKIAVESKGNLSKSLTIYLARDYYDAGTLISDGASFEATVSADGSFSAEIDNLRYLTKFNFVAVASVHDKEFRSVVSSFNTEDFPYYAEEVDLGLSVNWSSCNIGALDPWDTGFSYSWGETEEKDSYGWNDYKWASGEENRGYTKYNTNPSFGKVDNLMTLEAEDDAATVHLGEKWRTPTKAEWEELVYNCSWEWTDDYNGTGENGFIVTSLVEGFEGKSIFLPETIFAGSKVQYSFSYHSASLELGEKYEDDLENRNPTFCACLTKGNDGPVFGSGYRMHGRGIRPVSDKKEE